MPTMPTMPTIPTMEIPEIPTVDDITSNMKTHIQDLNTDVEEYESAIGQKIAGVQETVKSKYEEVQNGMTSMADQFTWPWESYTNSLSEIGTKPADYYKSFQEIVEQNGFGFEEHEVTTDDGYVLHVMRIMNKEVQSGVKRPVVFL